LDRDNNLSWHALSGALTTQIPDAKNYRDKVVAHTAVLERPPPFVDELRNYAMGTADLLARLARGTGVVGLDLGAQMAAYDESAKAFWSVWRDRK